MLNILISLVFVYLIVLYIFKQKIITFFNADFFTNMYYFYINVKVRIFLIFDFYSQYKKSVLIFSIFFFLFCPVLKYYFLVCEISVNSVALDMFFTIISPALATILIERKSIWADVEIDIKEELAKAKEKLSVTEKDKIELENLVNKFFNDAKFTDQGVSDLFRLSSKDYFCVMKSSENFDLLFKKKKKIKAAIKLTQIPFGNVLNNHPNKIRPFGNLEVYFFPYSILSQYDGSIKQWIDKTILPEVKIERVKYIKKYKDVLELNEAEIKFLEKDSYVYLGFEINSNNIAFDIKGNNLNEELFKIIKGNKEHLLAYTHEISKAIRSNDLFLRVEWNTIIDLSNKKQMQDLNNYSDMISNKLKEKNINSIAEIANMDVILLTNILFEYLKSENWSILVCKNKAKLITSSITKLLMTLRKANVQV